MIIEYSFSSGNWMLSGWIRSLPLPLEELSVLAQMMLTP